ncbi:hypothetical protein O181_015639 [Austropuccinia psidii MF-1]|uniref:Uncharacterized protein n=1 Tax=Austropuccinia psidii MF-1 TaxID=1389203 RepID=A0A9Q3C2D3_9BASI|nr:hypothetical protein [Austropuccinia psidii MF-1]
MNLFVFFYIFSSITASSSDSTISESSIEFQTSPAPSGSIAKEPIKGRAGEFNPFIGQNFFKIDVGLLLLELEVTNPFNQMDLDQEIQVINQKGKNVIPEERHKWRMPEIP